MKLLCVWCGKRKTKLSDWEQKRLNSEEYKTLCIPCKTKRLNNPLNALLPMREIVNIN